MTTIGDSTIGERGISDRGQMRPGYRNPPHSREAEESVIGAVLLSEEAVNEVMDVIHPEDFYCLLYTSPSPRD